MKSILLRLWTSPTASTWAAFMARSLNLLLVTSLVLPRFSEEETALWQMFAVLISLQTLADFGFNPTMVRLAAYAMGGAETLDGAAMGERKSIGSEPNWALLSRLAASMRWLYARLALGLAVLFLLMGTAALLRRVAALAHPSLKTLAHSGVHTPVFHAWLAWGCIIFTTWFSFTANAYGVFLQGTNHVALVRRWESIFGLGSIVGSAVAIWLTRSLLGLVVANQVWFVLGAIRNRWLARSVLEGRFCSFPAPAYHADIMRITWPAAWRSGLGSMAYGVFQAADLVAGQYRDSSVVASYLMARRLANTISAASQAPFYSRIPVYARLWAQQKQAELTSLAQRNMAFALWAFVVPFVVGAWAFPWGMKLIGSRTSFARPEMWFAIGLALWFERYGSMHLQLISASHRVVSHIAQGVTALEFAVLAAVGYHWLGILALPVAMLVGNAGFLAGYARWKSGELFGLPTPGFDLKTALGPLVVLLAAGAIALRSG